VYQSHALNSDVHRSFQNYGLSVDRLFHINLLAPEICRHY